MRVVGVGGVEKRKGWGYELNVIDRQWGFLGNVRPGWLGGGGGGMSGASIGIIVHCVHAGLDTDPDRYIYRIDGN